MEVIGTRSIVYADESGYSGSHFMDPDSPFFVSVSTSLSPDEAFDLLASSIGSIKGREYKYRLATRARRISGLRILLEKVADIPEEFVFHLCDKCFALLCVWVENWLFPWLRAHSIDAHAQRFSRFMPNAFYYMVPQLHSKLFLNRLLRQFEKMMRASERIDAQRQGQKLFSLATQPPPILTRDWEEMISILIVPIYQLGLGHLRGIPRLAMDVALPSLAFSANLWKRRLKRPWSLYHDKSSHLSHHQDLWRYFTSNDFGVGMFFYHSGPVEFPLDIESTHFVDSRDNYAIQLCDVIAGALRDRLLLDFGYPSEASIRSLVGDLDLSPVVQGFLGADPNAAEDYLLGKTLDTSEARDWFDARAAAFEAGVTLSQRRW